MTRILGLYIGIISILAVLLFVPFSLHLASAAVNSIDPLLYSWNLHHNFMAATGAYNSLTDTNMFYPLTNTLALSDTLFAQTILTAPILFLTNNSLLAQNLLILASFPLSAVAMFFLAHWVTKDTKAALLAGLFFAFSYPRLSQIGHLPMINSQWVPLAILFTVKFFSDGTQKNLLFAFLYYVLGITSSIYFGVYILPVFALISVFYLVTWIRNKNVAALKNRFVLILKWLVPFIVVLVVVLFPYLILKLEHPDLRRTLEEQTYFRARPIDYISILPTSLISFTGLPQSINEHVLFPTLTLLVLAVVGLVSKTVKSKFVTYLFVAIAAVSLVLSFGHEYEGMRLPYYYLHTYIPLWESVRVPARLSLFVIVALSALAAIGIKTIVRKSNSMVPYLLIAGVFLFEIWQLHTPYVTVPAPPPVYSWLKSQPTSTVIAHVPISLFYHGSNMESQLYKSSDELVENDTYAIETLRLYYSTVHGKRMINGYSGYLPDSYNRLVEKLEIFPDANSIGALKSLGVNLIIVHSALYDDTRWTEIQNRLKNQTDITFIEQFENDYVYQINNE